MQLPAFSVSHGGYRRVPSVLQCGAPGFIGGRRARPSRLWQAAMPGRGSLAGVSFAPRGTVLCSSRKQNHAAANVPGFVFGRISAPSP